MRVCVAGLWHLGTVTAACLASADHDVTGLDFDEAVVSRLAAGTPPLLEPWLEELYEGDTDTAAASGMSGSGARILLSQAG